MLYKTLILLHICCATVGLLSGFLSVLIRKGSGLHRVAGTFFFVSMLGMAGSGAFIASFLRPNNGNIMGGLLMIYLTSTGWAAGRRRDRQVGKFDWISLLLILAVATAGATWGLQAVRSANGLKDGYPAPLYFIFGTIALLFAASDVRFLLRGGFAGAQRIARHLWRVCLALLFATLSFYPGQSKLFSKALLQSSLLYVPHVFLAGATIFWMFRVLGRKRAARMRIAAHPQVVAVQQA